MGRAHSSENRCTLGFQGAGMGTPNRGLYVLSVRSGIVEGVWKVEDDDDEFKSGEWFASASSRAHPIPPVTPPVATPQVAIGKCRSEKEKERILVQVVPQLSDVQPILSQLVA
ncbi:jg6613 [Pararge aegeria aegeria]|uniref:Jg6613 protein n=1 Tax=Pararge aegeria aegeria TaxID=348720 RepID=A0A8S4RY24_9NEOP|nr:jg6613 [Pararge aegeria aegeria]